MREIKPPGAKCFGRLFVEHRKFTWIFFYDERESYVVPDELQINSHSPVLADYAYHQEKDTFKNALADLELTFELKDISYIIVKEEAEIPQVYNVLVTAFEQKLESLTPIRVLTSEQIISDF